jgi:hypothetical protein
MIRVHGTFLRLVRCSDMARSISRVAVLVGAFTLACGSAPDAPAPNLEPSLDASPAPRYSELFERYFAPDTAGHCANAGCHADPGHTVWRCGPTKDDCYAGMSEIGLIDGATPAHSAIVDPHRSPLTWINPTGGNMPLDAQGQNSAAGEALRAWVAAGARND